jgi:hypothetical protein
VAAKRCLLGIVYPLTRCSSQSIFRRLNYRASGFYHTKRKPRSLIQDGLWVEIAAASCLDIYEAHTSCLFGVNVRSVYSLFFDESQYQAVILDSIERLASQQILAIFTL